MADIQITPLSVNMSGLTTRTQVWVSPSICYQFYSKTDTYTSESLNCRKSTDGGQTWGTDIKISSVAPVANAANQFAVWFDQWTPGDAGTKIHCHWVENIQGQGGSYERYRALDTSNDSLGTETLIQQWGITALGSVSIVKAKGGNLYSKIEYDTYRYLRRSTDGGATWTSRTGFPAGAPQINELVGIFLVPANLVDQNDVYMIGLTGGGAGATIILWEYDDSADSWTSTTVGTHDSWLGDRNLAAMVRHSDGHILVPFITAGYGFPGTQDCVFYDITNAGTITQKTSVFTGAASFTRRYVDIVIDQLTDDIYVAYYNDTTSKIEVQKSSDGGTTWGSADFFNDAGSGHVFWLGQSTADSGGRVYATWSPVEVWGNYAHSIALVRSRRVFIVA